MGIRFIVLAVTTVFLCAATVDAEEMNPVVGKAGDFVLREADLDRLISNQSADAQQIIQSSPEQRSNFIRQVLLAKATASKARKEGFDRKPETRELISSLIDQYLAQEYLNKVVIANISVSDDDLKKYYSEHEKEFLIPEAVKVRHIFVSSLKDSPVEVKEKARLKAEGILNKVRQGEDFSRIAKEQSEDADSAAKGGDLGYITEGKTNSVEFEKAVFALKSSESGSLIETPFGFHITKIDDRKEKRIATLNEAREYITTILKEDEKKKKIQDFLDSITKESGLEVIGQSTPTAK